MHVRSTEHLAREVMAGQTMEVMGYVNPTNDGLLAPWMMALDRAQRLVDTIQVVCDAIATQPVMTQAPIATPAPFKIGDRVRVKADYLISGETYCWAGDIGVIWHSGNSALWVNFANQGNTKMRGDGLWLVIADQIEHAGLDLSPAEDADMEARFGPELDAEIEALNANAMPCAAVDPFYHPAFAKALKTVRPRDEAV